MTDVTTFRLYLLRTVYLLNFIGLGASVWPGIINHQGAWDPVRGAAFCFWAALSLLCAAGIRYPLRMLPLLLLQLLYKSIWVVVVAAPQWSAGRTTEMTTIFVTAIVIDLVVIPWPYVLSTYVKQPGDRWRASTAL